MKHTSKKARQARRLKTRLLIFAVATIVIWVVLHYLIGERESFTVMASSELLCSVFDKAIDLVFFGGAE